MLLRILGKEVDPQAEEGYTRASTLNFEKVIDGRYGQGPSGKRRGGRGGESKNAKEKRKNTSGPEHQSTSNFVN